MSWKNAERNARRAIRSISVRLTLFYTLTALAAIVLFTAVLYLKLTANFNTEHLRFLRAKSQELTQDFQDGGSQPEMVLSEISKETAGTALRQYEARVLTLQHVVLGQTPGMNAWAPVRVFPLPVQPAAINPSATRDWFAGGHHYVLVAFGLPSQASADNAYTVQLALDVSRDDALLADYRRGLVIFLLLLVPVLIVTGRVVTLRGLRPLERVTRAALAVTPTRLVERIPLDPPWPPELEELVRVFNAMMERLDEAFARLSRFSADLAHELRNPLNNIMGEMEVCLTRERGAAEYRATLSSGLEECRRLAALIENLLFIARTEETGHSLGITEINAREACERVLAFHAMAAADRRVHLVCEGEARLRADPILFRQALSNLLANAIRHSPAGSKVCVAVCTPAAGNVEIAVRDQGVGIAPEHLPHVFDRFYQVDPSRSPRGQGTGLGLSIVRSIMELHGGTAILESQPDVGTTARICFPTEAPSTKMTELSSL
jgi:two-component system heavy metal sensor histidine kinase CusS